jgi:transcriptional regulator with XRE-family HTH domain
MMAKLQKSETFGGRLTEAREEAERWDGKGIGYNQGELADLLAERFGVTIGRSYISELERSWQKNKMPSMEVGRALAQALKVNFAWLALLSEEKELPDAAGDVAWSKTTNALMSVVDKWPEAARQPRRYAAGSGGQWPGHARHGGHRRR